MSLNSNNQREPFWRAPRWLARELEDGHLKPGEFALVMYLGMAGHDEYGRTFTLQYLADLFEVSKRSIQRYLTRLTELCLVEHDLRQGQRTPFRIRISTGLAPRPHVTETPPPGVTSRASLSQVATYDTASPEARLRSPVTCAPVTCVETENKEHYSGIEQVGPGPELRDVELPLAVKVARVGEEGFASFLHELRRLRVLAQDDVLRWLRLHGAVMRARETPLDTGDGIPDELLAELERELGEAAT